MITATPAPSTPARASRRWAITNAARPEIGLGLAAAGREEQQVSNLAIGVRSIDQAGEVEQDEGELERPPLRLIDEPAGSPVAPALRRRAAMATARFMKRNAVRALAFGGEKFDAGGDPGLGRLHLRDQRSRRLCADAGSPSSLLRSGLDPAP